MSRKNHSGQGHAEDFLGSAQRLRAKYEREVTTLEQIQQLLIQIATALGLKIQCQPHPPANPGPGFFK